MESLIERTKQSYFITSKAGPPKMVLNPNVNKQSKNFFSGAGRLIPKVSKNNSNNNSKRYTTPLMFSGENSNTIRKGFVDSKFKLYATNDENSIIGDWSWPTGEP